MTKIDDAVRERHGVQCLKRDDEKRSHIDVWEGEDYIYLETESMMGGKLTTWQARYLAAKLYRLSRRIRQRTED